MTKEAVNHPRHYNAHPSGIECIDIVEHMGFNLGNAMKYIWRADEKGNAVEDLKKAEWYVRREIENLQRLPSRHAELARSGLRSPAVRASRCVRRQRSREARRHLAAACDR
jgi:hypothetical protein